MLGSQVLEDVMGLLLVLDYFKQISLIAVNSFLDVFDNEDLVTLLFIDTLSQLLLDNLLNFIVVDVSEIKYLFVIGTSLVMSDILVLLLKKRSSDSLDIEEQGFSLDVLIQD